MVSRDPSGLPFWGDTDGIWRLHGLLGAWAARGGTELLTETRGERGTWQPGWDGGQKTEGLQGSRHQTVGLDGTREMIWRTPSDPEGTLQPKRLAGWPGTLEVTVLCLNPDFNPSSGVL